MLVSVFAENRPFGIYYIVYSISVDTGWLVYCALYHMLLWYSSFFDSNNCILHCYSQEFNLSVFWFKFVLPEYLWCFTATLSSAFLCNITGSKPFLNFSTWLCSDTHKRLYLLENAKVWAWMHRNKIWKTHTHTHLHIYTFFQHPLSLYTLVQQSLRQITVGPASMSPNSQSYSTYPSKPWQTAM